MTVAELLNNDDSDSDNDSDVIKILVVGEQKCGKSSFIRTFAGLDFAGLSISETGSTVYRYEYYHFGELRKYDFIEVPGVNQALLDRAIYLHSSAKGCILMYAIDDHSSLQQIKNKWYPKLEYFHIVKRIPMIAVGFKADLRENQPLDEPIGLRSLLPVTYLEGQSLTTLPQVLRCFECSKDDPARVNAACTYISNQAYENSRK